MAGIQVFREGQKTKVQEEHDIVVVTHDGVRASERPKAVILDGDRLDVVEVERAWIETGVETTSDVIHGFVVRCFGGARFRLLYSDRYGWKSRLLPGPRLVRG